MIGNVKMENINCSSREVDFMEFRSAIVDELGCVMYWCDELQDEDQIECILNSHPEWSRKCIEM